MKKNISRGGALVAAGLLASFSFASAQTAQPAPTTQVAQPTPTPVMQSTGGEASAGRLQAGPPALAPYSGGQSGMGNRPIGMPQQGSGMGNGMGGRQGGPMMGMGDHHEDPMFRALGDIEYVLSGGLLPTICNGEVDQGCFNNLQTAVKRGSRTYRQLVADLTTLENNDEIGSMQMFVNFARMVNTFPLFTTLIQVAELSDSGDLEAAFSTLQSVLPSAKGPLRTMLRGVSTNLEEAVAEMSDQEARMTEDAASRQQDRAARRAGDTERRTQEQAMRENMQSAVGPTGTNARGMYPEGSERGQSNMGGMQGHNMPMNPPMGIPMGLGMPSTVDDARRMYEQTTGRQYTPEMAAQFTAMRQNGGMMQPMGAGSNPVGNVPTNQGGYSGPMMTPEQAAAMARNGMSMSTGGSWSMQSPSGMTPPQGGYAMPADQQNMMNMMQNQPAPMPGMPMPNMPMPTPMPMMSTGQYQPNVLSTLGWLLEGIFGRR